MTADPDQDVQRAAAANRLGDATEAERICLDVLTRQPAHFGALHLLGIIAFQAGRMGPAIERLSQAIAARPRSAEAYNNLGAVLGKLGRFDNALVSYAQSIALNPDHAGAHYNHANALRALGRPEEALASYDRTLALRPDFADAHYNRANTLRELGRHADALASYDTAAHLRPDFAGVHNNRGQTLRALHRFEEALASYDRAIALRPDFAEVHNNRGNALRDLERLDDALASYDRAIALKPSFAEAHNNRGTVLSEMERPADALASHDTALALDPNFAAAHANRGNALTALGRPEEALPEYDKALALNPDDAAARDSLGCALAALGQFDAALSRFDAALTVRPDHAGTHANRGNVLRALMRHEEAMASYGTALALKPGDAGILWNQSLCHLAMGDYETGWRGFERRWESELRRAKRTLSGQPWLGDSPIDGKTIYVHAEQGLGDTLQFCRYVPLLAARARVILDVQPPLLGLLSGLEGVADVVATRVPPREYDTWTPLLSLPLAFGTTLATIPADVPYLNADPEQSAAWTNRLAELPGRKIGLVWAGSPRHEQPGAQLMDRRRSIGLARYAPLAAIPGLSLISLQKGDAAAQARTPPAGMTLHDWTDELDDFADTAALVAALDLVISVDTSVAHLAGALGKPVWVLNRYDQCWRWLRDRTDSPWYPTARLFRQDAPGAWSGVIDAVAAALRAWP